jgi:ATP-dependent DNA helicase RecQ
MSHAERSQVQQDWIQNKTRVMVATNAFGMGIDKADVRLVVHLDLPDTLEAYYQEAGRGGRDEKYAYATLLLSPNDTADLRRKVTEAQPPVELLRRVYQCLANYYQIAVGSGEFQSFDFNLEDFARNYKLKPLEVHHCLQKLQTEGFLQVNDAYFSPSKVLITLEHEELYKFQVANPELDPLLQVLLRLYGGNLYISFVKISEKVLAEKLKVPVATVKKHLTYLQQRNILDYDPQHDTPQVVFTTPRYDALAMPINVKRYNDLRANALAKMEEVIRYVTTTGRCRTQLLLAYFGELSDEPCRICDHCLQQKKARRETAVMEKLQQQIRDQLAQGKHHPKDLAALISHPDKEVVSGLITQLVDLGQLEYETDGKLRWVE